LQKWTITFKTKLMKFLKGDLFESNADALVNTVNTVGVMGKGVAFQFKKLFPHNYNIYKKRCESKDFQIGDLLLVEDENILTGKKLIINFPTKKHWRHPSKYEYIQIGLEKLKTVIIERNIKSIAIPPLGSGNGGLKWDRVKEMMIKALDNLNTEIYIYEPNKKIRKALLKEKVKLTPARAMLMYMLFQLVRNGEFVSEFACEKLCYFLQRFGAKGYFKLQYSKRYYGPYSGTVRHLMSTLNGSYLAGYDSKDTKPFEYVDILQDGEKLILDYIKNKDELKKIVDETSDFLDGFYSYFGLELLSSIDFILQTNKATELNQVVENLNSWNTRKKELFADDYRIEVAYNHLKNRNISVL